MTADQFAIRLPGDRSLPKGWKILDCYIDGNMVIQSPCKTWHGVCDDMEEAIVYAHHYEGAKENA